MLTYKKIWTKKLRKTLIAAIVSSLLLLSVSYLFSHISLPMSTTEFVALKHAEQIMIKVDSTWAQKDSTLLQSVRLINTCYDFDVIPHYSSSTSLPQGYTTISKRKDIYHLLQAFSRDTSSYRYIMLDIALDSIHGNTPQIDTLMMYTDSLVHLICAMPRICVPRSSKFNLVSDSLIPKAGMVDYNISLNVSSFVKYDLHQDSAESMPLKMYHDLSGRTIKKYLGGLFYKDGRVFCKRNIIPTFPYRLVNVASIPINENGDITGYELNPKSQVEDLHEVCENRISSRGIEGYENKIVVIGDLFVHDLHITYVEDEMSGAIINLNTYLNLEKGNHLIKGWEVLCLLIFYVLMFLFVVGCEKWWYKIPFWQRFWQADITQFIISFVSWTVLFHGLAILLYRYGIFYNIWLPIVWFTLISKIYKLIIQPKYEN